MCSINTQYQKQIQLIKYTIFIVYRWGLTVLDFILRFEAESVVKLFLNLHGIVLYHGAPQLKAERMHGQLPCTLIIYIMLGFTWWLVLKLFRNGYK